MVKIAHQVSIDVNTSEGYVYFADGLYSGAFGGGCGRGPNDYNNNSSMVTECRKGLLILCCQGHLEVSSGSASGQKQEILNFSI